MSKAWQTKSIKTLCPENSVGCTLLQVVLKNAARCGSFGCVKRHTPLDILDLSHAKPDMPSQVMSTAWQTESIKTLCLEKSVEGRSLQVIEQWCSLRQFEVCQKPYSPWYIGPESYEHWYDTTIHVKSLTNSIDQNFVPPKKCWVSSSTSYSYSTMLLKLRQFAVSNAILAFIYWTWIMRELIRHHKSCYKLDKLNRLKF